jgi:glycerophosphoryl diester phosphodiesterase
VTVGECGGAGNFPENTIPAFESALQLGADFAEVDVRTTRDGALVVIHDGTVDRTTNGTGNVRSFTLAEIRALDAGSWFGPQFAGLRVPTFAEVATLVKSYGRRMYVDFKEGTADALYGELQRAGMEDRVVVYSGPVRMKQLQVLDPRILPMPEAVNTLVLNVSISFFDPLQVVAFNDNDFRDPVIALAKSIGADVYVDRLGSADVPDVWQDAIDRGATGIQTDKPGPLLEFLRAGGYHP